MNKKAVDITEAVEMRGFKKLFKLREERARETVAEMPEFPSLDAIRKRGADIPKEEPAEEQAPDVETTMTGDTEDLST